MESTENNSSFSQTFDSLKSAVKDAVEQRVQLAKLEATEKGAILSARLAFIVMAAVVGLFTLIFLSIALGFYFAHLTESMLIGFSIVAGLYLVVLIILIMARQKLMSSITNAIIAAFLHDPQSHEQPENLTHEQRQQP